MRFHLAASLSVMVSALALAACSGGSQPEATETTDAATEVATEAPMAVASEAAPEASASPVETASATPTPSPTPTPTAAPTPTPTKSAAPAAAAEPTTKVAAAAPVAPASFARCAVCHNAAKGAGDKLGPNLWGVYGHPMGQGSFAFSDAVKNSGLTLDEATLDKWIENPRALVPGNMMSFPGIKDPAKRQEIIDYLKQLH